MVLTLYYTVDLMLIPSGNPFKCHQGFVFAVYDPKLVQYSELYKNLRKADPEHYNFYTSFINTHPISNPT